MGRDAIAAGQTPGPTRKRIRLAAVPHDPDGANVWADVTGDGEEINVELLHAYPDLHPAVGWWLECEGKEYEVTTTLTPEGQPVAMICKPKGGA